MAKKTMIEVIGSAAKTLPLGVDMIKRGKFKLLKSFLGPAYNGLIVERGKDSKSSSMKTGHDVYYDWSYESSNPEIEHLYSAAKSAQWNVSTDLDWSMQVYPLDTKNPIIPDRFCPAAPLTMWQKLTPHEQAIERQSLLSWFLSQILHSEQGALYATAQIVQAVPWIDGKLFGAIQIGDEARHVEVFHRYLNEKLGKTYEINDNMYVLIEAIMQDPRWDIKFLGMQIMLEGFGLGAFRAIKEIVNEPLLKKILQYVIADEARHVHYGVLALKQFYSTELNEKEMREREDLALEISLLLKKRLLAHEIYHEFYSSKMSIQQWDKFSYESELMSIFRNSMFNLIIPNLMQLGLMSDRVKPMYRKHGLLGAGIEKSAPNMILSDYALAID